MQNRTLSEYRLFAGLSEEECQAVLGCVGGWESPAQKGELLAHAGEDIYYRLDHHWTSLGAYYGYAALPMEPDHLTYLTSDLLDACIQYFPPEEEEREEDDVIKVAVIGKPNVGKSSLVNKVAGENRCIVSDIAGTTRDAVDTTIQNQHGTFTFIDTAGLRRKSKVEDAIEHYSNLRAEMAVERADVCLILIDAQVGFTEQDSKVAGIAHEAGKGCIICVNKWDAVEKQTGTLEEFSRKIRTELKFMDYAPVLFLSALTGQRVHKLMGMVRAVHEQATRRITTGLLNDVLADAQNALQPPSMSGRRLRIYYATQASVAPPTFVLFVNDETLMHFSYERYLNNAFRKAFGFEGTPIRIVVRSKKDGDDL